MYVAIIKGWTTVATFSEDEEKAKKLAIEKKKSFARDDLDKWNWETVSDYYGAFTEKIKEGTILTDI